MRTTNIRRVAASAALLAIAGCGGATAAGANSAGSPTPQAATSSAPIASATVSGHGVVLVAGFNGMTLYQFAQDVAGSGTSACSGGCITTWPPLTVPTGTSPTAATGISGQLGTLTRTDGKGIQVTFNGLPLHFYSGDTKPGDANGNYPGWSSVAASGGAAAPPAATPAGGGSSPSATAKPYGY